MDTQTITWVLGAVVLLVLINFLFLDDTANNERPTHHRTPVVVTPEMIDAVQAVAPTLTVRQIRADLQLTGNVQATVERYLAGVVVSEEDITHNVKPVEEDEKPTAASEDGPFDGLSFDQKKRQMILENRKKLEQKTGIAIF